MTMSRLFSSVLAQAQQDGPWEIMLWSGVLIGLLIVAWIAIAFFKNRSDSWQDPARTTPFTLHDLRRMHREGQLSDEEFERARQRILAMATRDTKPAEEDAADPNQKTPRGESLTPGETDRSDDFPDSSEERADSDPDGDDRPR